MYPLGLNHINQSKTCYSIKMQYYLHNLIIFCRYHTFISSAYSYQKMDCPDDSFTINSWWWLKETKKNLHNDLLKSLTQKSNSAVKFVPQSENSVNWEPKNCPLKIPDSRERCILMTMSIWAQRRVSCSSSILLSIMDEKLHYRSA